MIEPRQLDEAIAASHLAYRPYERKKLRFILNAIDQFTRDRGRELAEVSILEIGCGQGGVALPIARLGCRITAFDVDADEVAVLNSRAKDLGLDLTATVSNGKDYSDGRIYDIVIASEVFEHLTDPPGMVANIKKHMREASRLIVTVPNGYGPWQTLDRLSIRTRIRKSNLLRRLLQEGKMRR
jgi:2-polyprenyl-3-methyl-5-hydroxy-6-metoxy-1,4-benzoquinol methylase